MRTNHGFILGLILLCATQASLRGGEAETYSMDEVTERGTPPIQIKRVEPMVTEFNHEEPMTTQFGKRVALPRKATVDFIIDEQGRVRDPRVVRFGSPSDVEPMIEAIRTWRYTPGKMNGRPVRVAVTEEVESKAEAVLLVAPRRAISWQVIAGPIADRSVVGQEKLPPELQWEKPPVMLRIARPVYPLIALQAKQEGAAMIKYVVDPGGNVAAAQVLESTTPEMGHAALAAVETWAFTPATKKDGTPCSALRTAVFRFSYHGRAGMMVSADTRKVLRLLEKDSAGIVASEKLDRPLKPVLTRPPVYPVAMRNKTENGQAEVDVFIDTNGEVQLPAVASSTTPEFGYAAVQAISTWRFDVPRSGGKPVVTRTRVPVVFKQATPAQP
jgi:TonB family protein